VSSNDASAERARSANKVTASASASGATGITTSLGTGQLLADLVMGRKPAIDPEPYSPSRLLQTAHA